MINGMTNRGLEVGHGHGAPSARLYICHSGPSPMHTLLFALHIRRLRGPVAGSASEWYAEWPCFAVSCNLLQVSERIAAG